MRCLARARRCSPSRCAIYSLDPQSRRARQAALRDAAGGERAGHCRGPLAPARRRRHPRRSRTSPICWSRSAIITTIVAALLNPLRADRPSARFPNIVQDARSSSWLFFIVATFVLRDSSLVTASAVSAVVVGFALQDTLGNAFAGLAIQIEKPFRVGHWIKVGDHDGMVEEVTWRATKLRTRAGTFIIVPNSVISKEAITNYSEPIVPVRFSVDVGATYAKTPNEVKAAMLEAVGAGAAGADEPGAGGLPDGLRRLGDRLSRCASGSPSSTRRTPRSTRCARRSTTASPGTASRSRIRSRSRYSREETSARAAARRMAAALDRRRALRGARRRRRGGSWRRRRASAMFGAGEVDRPPGRHRPVAVHRPLAARCG